MIAPEQIGLFVGQNFYSPPHFAHAEVFSMSKKELKADLQAVVDSVLSERIDSSKTPLLEHVVFDHAQRGEHFGIEHLEQFVKKTTGTYGLIRKQAHKPTSKKVAARLSKASQIPISIYSEDGRKKSPHEFSIYHPFIVTLEDALQIRFAGGTRHSTTHQTRHILWKPEAQHEAEHLFMLQEAQNTDYMQPITVVDYVLASGLINIDKAHKEGRIKTREGIESAARVFIPFNFASAPHLRYELLLQRVAPTSLKKDVTGKKSFTLNDQCQYLLNKKGFTTPQAATLQKALIARKGVIAKNKLFQRPPNDPVWAIVQAVDSYMLLDKKRHVSAGFKVEYAGTPYQTYSVAYEFANEKNMRTSVRLLYDHHLGLPVLKYMTFEPKEFHTIFDGEWKQIKNHKTARLVQAGDPKKRVNVSQARNKAKTVFAMERDWETNRWAQTTIFEIGDEQLSYAANRLRKYGPNLSAYDLRGLYIQNFPL